MTKLVPAGTVLLGQQLHYATLTGRITAIEHGPTIGIYLAETGDLRWLINSATEVSMTT